MENVEKLKNARNILLKLHKSLIDREREVFEEIHGPLKASEFLNILLENADFAWLRKFSMLIVEIDEMFVAKDGVPDDLVNANLVMISELVEMTEEDEYFRAKYRNAVQKYPDVAGLQAELRSSLS